ncbi:MAG TPA: amino acid racemase [Clostridiaceae bacterium]|nr:amino acid racemase [Clostridiaceae bacterium]
MVVCQVIDIETTKGKEMRKVIGIIGGMGPMATCDLMYQIISNTKADRDQDHVQLLIDNNAAIPDRTEALVRGGPSPLPELIKSAKRLTVAGADALALSCNTSHYFMSELRSSVPIPFISMIGTTVERLRENSIKTVALLATEGLSKVGVYQKELEAAGIRPLVPDEKEQKIVTEVIYDTVKAGMPLRRPERFQSLLDCFRDRGAQKIILGCTELPIAVKEYNFNGDFIDPTYELALEIIRYSGAEVKDS